MTWTIKAHVPARDWRWVQVEVARPGHSPEWWTGELLFGGDTRARLAAISSEIAAHVAEVTTALAAPIQRWYLPPTSRGTHYASPDAALVVGARIAALMVAFDDAAAKHDVASGALAAQELLDLRDGAWCEAIKEVPKPTRSRGDSNDGFL
jgi:hypothetical protein